MEDYIGYFIWYGIGLFFAWFHASMELGGDLGRTYHSPKERKNAAWKYRLRMPFAALMGIGWAGPVIGVALSRGMNGCPTYFQNILWLPKGIKNETR